ncbi:MAG: hypothetical protein WC992_00145 [Acholeplasmataceae bacterium]|jgi:hypothetical protein
MQPVDLYLLGEQDNGRLTLRVNRDAQVCRGPAAAAQKFIACLLTIRGSDVSAPHYGSDFMSRLTQGQLRNEAQITMAFSAAAHQVISYLRSFDARSPEDEQIVGADIEDMQLAADSLTIRVLLWTAAGETVFTLPFNL